MPRSTRPRRSKSLIGLIILAPASRIGCGAIKRFNGDQSVNVPAALFRIRLVFRPRAIESGELEAGGLDTQGLRELIEGDLQPPRIVDLRPEIHVSHCDLSSARIRRGLNERLESLEA